MRQITFLATAVAIVSAGLLTSCNGFFPASDAIVSLTLSPNGAFIKPQTTQQFTATARFGNNSTGDVTDQVTWSSSATNIATIDPSGLATGVALGNTTITAKSGSVTATGLLTVSNKTISAITVSPSNPTILLSTGQQQQFTATATFSDGTIGDVTTSAAWTSSNTNVATISTTGLATPVSQGNTTIGASLGGVAGTTTLTVQ